MTIDTGIETTRYVERANQTAPGGLHSAHRKTDRPFVWDHAAGPYLYDIEGREYLDYHAAYGPILLGHCDPRVTEAVSRMAGTMDLGGTGVHPCEITLAERIVEAVPCADQVLFCTSGSEATYHCVRMARAVTGRPKIVKFQGAYHGWHDYLLMNVASKREKLGRHDVLSAGVLPEVVDQTLVARWNDLADVARLFSEHPGEIAGIIAEPIPHNVGALLPASGFLAGLKQLCEEHGALLIFDEIITGFRHALGGYQEVAQVTPDLTALGKALANGYPLAAVCGRREIMSHFSTAPGGDVYFSGTYNAHPLVIAAGIATLDALSEPGVYDHLYQLGARLRSGLQALFQEAGAGRYVGGFGSVVIPFFIDQEPRTYEDLLANNDAATVAFRWELVERGIFSLPVALKRDHIMVSFTEEHVDRYLEAAAEALRSPQVRHAIEHREVAPQR